MTPGRITLLLSSPRVAPGLLNWPAWELLKRARQVLTNDADHPQLTALLAAGVTLEVVEAADPGEAARRLVAEASTGADVVWLADADGSPELHRALTDAVARESAADREPTVDREPSVDPAERMGGGPELAVAAASYDLPGARLLDLISVMDKLRARCPWVREQTHRSLVRYLVEEAYETVEAIESGERAHLREELGDLLFQVVFHARLAQEGEDPLDPAGSGAWSIDEVAGDLVDKLVRRNPHVFGTATAGDAAEVEGVWDQLKAEEKGRTSAIEGVPLALPALTLADKLLGRTAGSGLDVPVPAEPAEEGTPAMPAVPAQSAGSVGATGSVETVSAPGRQAATARPPAADLTATELTATELTATELTATELTAAGLGDALLGLVDRARTAGLDPEQALRDACRRYVAAVHAAEAARPPRRR